MDATKFGVIGGDFLMKVEGYFGLLEYNRTDRGDIVPLRIMLLKDSDRSIITVLSVSLIRPPHLCSSCRIP